MPLERSQQHSAYVLRICSLYRNTCIFGTAIAHGDRCSVHSVGGLLTEIAYSTGSCLHVVRGFSTGHSRCPIGHRRVALHIRHSSQIRDIPVGGVAHLHVADDKLHELYRITARAGCDLIGNACASFLCIL